MMPTPKRPFITPRNAATGPLAIAATTMLAMGLTAQSAVYTITPIPTFGGSESFGHGINASGVVAGYAKNAAGQNRALMFDGTTLTDLGTLGGADSQAFAINDVGQVAGYSKNSSGQERGFRYSGGTMTALGTLGGTSSYGFAINSSGQMTGGATTVFDTAYHAFRFTPPSTMTDLGAMGGPFGASEGAGIDDDGSVVGYTTVSFTSQQAFVHRNNQMTLLGTLGGNYSYAQAIRNGVIVGGAFLPGDTAFHATRWSDGTVTDLGTLPGLPSSIAYALNATGQIVGKSDAGTSATERAFLHLGGTMLDLNDLVPEGSGWLLQQARGINSSGQIAGFGTFNGQNRGFRLELMGKIWANINGGAWGGAANWFSSGQPTGGQKVWFLLDGAYTVNVAANASAGDVSLKRGQVSINVAGGNTLSLSGAVDISVGAALAAVGAGEIAGGTLRVADGGTFGVVGGMASWNNLDSAGTVRAGAGGKLRLVGSGATATTRSLVIEGSPGAWTGQVDIGGRALVIDYDASAVSPLPDVADQVRTGRASGGWEGNGIISSSADANSLAVGFAEATDVFTSFPASFMGRSVDNSAVLLRLTRYGDANLDGSVNLGDFAALASNFNNPGTWASGDFNYDGGVGIGDFSILAANFNTSVTSSVSRPGAVPEPAMSAISGAVGWLLSRRRREATR